MTSMSSELEPAILILIITWMSITEKYTVTKAACLCLEYDRQQGVARLRRRRRRRRCRVYAPTSNTASHDNHEKINSWLFLSQLSMGLRLAVLGAAGAPLQH